MASRLQRPRAKGKPQFFGLLITAAENNESRADVSAISAQELIDAIANIASLLARRASCSPWAVGRVKSDGGGWAVRKTEPSVHLKKGEKESGIKRVVFFSMESRLRRGARLLRGNLV